MSEELSQNGLEKHGLKIGIYEYYSIGATTLNDLIKFNIIPDKDYGKYNRRKPDGLLVDRRNKSQIEVIAVIEYKKGGKFRTVSDKKSATEQCNDLSQVLGAKMGIVTDNSDFIWINPSQADASNEYTDIYGTKRSYSYIKDDKKQKLIRPFIISNPTHEIDFEKLDDTTKETLMLIEQIIKSVSEENSYILPEHSNDPTPLAKQIWQDVWSVSGATPENCLYTFVELFIFKYLSDLEVLDKNDSGDIIHFDYVYSKGEQYAFQNYNRNVRPFLKKIFPPEKPVEEGGTTIINGTVLTGGVEGHDKIFYKILTRFKNFGKLSHIDPNFKSNLFESFLKESISKKNWGQFFTPRKVVKAIVSMSGIENLPDGAKVADPFSGVGGFLLEPLINQRKNDFYVKGNQIHQKLYYYGYEKGFAKDEQKTVILAKANMLIFLSDLLSKNKGLTKEFANVFNNTFHLRTKSILGTLDLMEDNADYTGKYNLILTNPPYVTSGSRNLKDAIKSSGTLSSFYKTNAMGVEGLALEWIIKNLEVGGKAFVVIPDGILNRINDSKMRQFILDECYLDALISLPINTFFTTPKKTYILAVTKKANKSDIQSDPVFTYLVSNIGETLDVYRFNIDENDLEEAKNQFNMFKGAKQYYKTSDKRCKIQPIEVFKENVKKHWSVDRWWTKEEKIELGIEDEENEVSKEDFIELLKAKNLEFKSLIEESEEILKKKVVSDEEHEMATVSLSDKKFFNTDIGTRVLKKDLFADKDKNFTIPLYSANINSVFGYVEKTNLKSFKHPYVIWGIDGNFDLNIMEKGEEFATTDHCGSIEILDEGILPQYLQLILQQRKHQLGFDRTLRASLTNVRSIEIKIPKDESGDFDVEKQAELVKQYNGLAAMKRQAISIKDEISSIRVGLEDDFQFKEVKLIELFNIEKGFSKYTKKYGNDNPGEYPVYSASNKKPLTHLNHYDYDGTYLTWATNGFGGYMKLIEGKFSVNGDRGILVPKSDNTNIRYVKYVLEPILRGLAKGRLGDRGKNEFTKVPKKLLNDVFIKMPIDTLGEIDVKKQEELASQFDLIESIKANFCDSLDEVVNLNVSIG